ncbi:hypothetical protein ACWDTI_25345 [Gordonia sp. NPDC003424]
MTSPEWLQANAPDYGPDAGEMSWGRGLTPPGLEDAPPSQGGRYGGRTPKAIDPDGLRALADELDERHSRGGGT